MPKIWRNCILRKTKFYVNCPDQYKSDVLNLLKDDVSSGIITSDEFFELTGVVYDI